jgi:hypothetical protein
MSGKSRPQIATSPARRRTMPGQNHQGASEIISILSKSDPEVVNGAPTTRSIVGDCVACLYDTEVCV